MMPMSADTSPFSFEAYGISIDYGQNPANRAAQMLSFQVGSAEVSVHADNHTIPIRQASCLMLASLGLDNSEIGKRVGNSKLTVKAHLAAGFHQLQVVGRSALALSFIHHGIYQIDKLGEPLLLTPQQAAAVEAAADGSNNDEIAALLHIASDTVKVHLARARKVNHEVRREGLILRNLVSRPQFLHHT